MALFLSVLLLVGCSQPASLHGLHGETMGTTWSVKLVGLPAGSTLPEVQQDIQALLDAVNRQMSTYRDDSEITRLNRAQAGDWVAVSPDFMAVLEQAVELAARTEGAYDPTVGPLVNLWGFGPQTLRLEPPAEQALEAARQRVGVARLEMDKTGLRLRQPGGLYLDLSSIAKGHAVDKIADYLAARGLDAYLVEVGGELRAAGVKPGGQPWRIAVERPIAGIRDVETVIETRDLAMATSGDYRNFFEADGRLFSHIIDPRTGRPVAHTTASVTVLHRRCSQADAWATALAVLGHEQGLRIAEQQGLAVLFLERTGEGVKAHRSPAFVEALNGGAL